MLTHGLLIVSLLFGQQQDAPQKQQEEGFRIGVAVDQVFLSVNARSIEGGFVQDLTKEEFQVSEDGVKQGIVNFYSAGVPVHVILLIDISGSTRESQGHIRRAALGFAKSLGPEDRVTIVTFNDAPRLILDWTNDIERIELALGSIYAKGYTVLNDALYVVFDDLLKEVQGKKAVIVLTDGIDNNSMVGQDEVVNLATRSETMVYVVSKLAEYWAGAIAARMEYRASAQLIPKQLTDEFIIGAKRFLTRLAQRTGGKVLDSKAFNSLTDVYQQVAEELKNQYYISYIPSNIMKDGKWRNVEVRVNLPGVVVSTRPGYYAPLEPGGN
ncbi:VWA domain-containing protein [Acidobacteria bacterium AH-259-O06]|nr:VWA domain-containing protein [Acidobacteria bacterium AH-259-O06]